MKYGNFRNKKSIFGARYIKVTFENPFPGLYKAIFRKSKLELRIKYIYILGLRIVWIK